MASELTAAAARSSVEYALWKGMSQCTAKEVMGVWAQVVFVCEGITIENVAEIGLVFVN